MKHGIAFLFLLLAGESLSCAAMTEDKPRFAIAFVALRKITIPSAQDFEKALKTESGFLSGT